MLHDLRGVTKRMRNKKKIIRAVTVAQSLGFCREVMLKMRNQGYEMIAVTSPGEELERLRLDDGFKCIEVPMERRVSLFRDFRSLLKMILVFMREKPQVVHSMTPKAGMLCMVAAWLTRVPVRIHTFTGLVWPTTVGAKRKVLMATDWLTCACATHVIPEGQGVLNDLKNGGITRKPMKVLGYGNVRGIDMERFNPGRFPVKKDNGIFSFVFVGRIVGDKGINELVEAFTKLHGKYAKTKLTLVGKYEEVDPISERTQQLIDTNCAIEVVGAKYNDELIIEYSKADCFVMPSYREGFPNTVIEAGAMGLPSIVTDINGSREIIIEGENGFIVPIKDPKALHDAMERMLTDNVTREQMASKARNLIMSRFEKNFVQQCQIAFYKEIEGVL